MQKGRHCFGAVLVFLILWVVILVVFFSESFLSVISISPSSLKNKNSLRNANKSGSSKSGSDLYDVTLVSQTSIDRFSLFADEIVRRWNGMISVSIHVDDENAQSIRVYMSQHIFPERVRLSYVKDNSGHYPINRLRNVAINNTITSHFWLTDIDIWPASDLYETILSLPSSLLSVEKQAIVVPAYEVLFDSKQLMIPDKNSKGARSRDGTCTDLEACLFKHLFMVPHHKQELMSCLQYGPCDTFKKKQQTHVRT